MKYALFIAEIKTLAGHEYTKPEHSFLLYLGQTPSLHQGVTILNQGTLLLDVRTGLNALSYLVEKANSFHIPHKVLFFDQEPSWVFTNNKD